MKLPEIRKCAHWIEEKTKPSVTVLARMAGDKNIYQGYFSYGLGEWFVDGFQGKWVVEEWWDLPVVGTGNSVKEQN